MKNTIHLKLVAFWVDTVKEYDTKQLSRGDKRYMKYELQNRTKKTMHSGKTDCVKTSNV